MPFDLKIHSKAQARAMSAKCHGAKLTHFKGLSQSKACEMVQGETKQKYNRLPERKGKKR